MSPKILILESQLIIAADLSLQLTKLGYNVIGINKQAIDALNTIQNNRPDIVIMNIDSHRPEKRLQTADIISKNYQIPVVFVSAHNELEIFKEAIKVKPYAFITKPFQAINLQKNLEMVLNRMYAEHLFDNPPQHSNLNKLNNVPFGTQPYPLGKPGLPFGNRR